MKSELLKNVFGTKEPVSYNDIISTSEENFIDLRKLEYKIEIDTSWRGTDSEVFFQIHGDKGSTAKIKIDNSGDTFEPNGSKTDKFTWPAERNTVQDVGIPYAIELSAPKATNWGISYILVKRVEYEAVDSKKILQEDAVKFTVNRRIGNKVEDKKNENILFWPGDGRKPKSISNTVAPVVERLWTVIENNSETSFEKTIRDTYTISASQIAKKMKREAFHNEITINVKETAEVKDVSKSEVSVGLKKWLETEMKTESESSQSSTLTKEISFPVKVPKKTLFFMESVITTEGAISTYEIPGGKKVHLVNPTGLSSSERIFTIPTDENIDDQNFSDDLKTTMKLIYQRIFGSSRN